MENYDILKKFILSEYELTPREYKARFDSAAKRIDETYMLYAARLRNLLAYYLRSRGVEKFDALCVVIVSDKMKSGLPAGPLTKCSL